MVSNRDRRCFTSGSATYPDRVRRTETASVKKKIPPDYVREMSQLKRYS